MLISISFSTKNKKIFNNGELHDQAEILCGYPEITLPDKAQSFKTLRGFLHPYFRNLKFRASDLRSQVTYAVNDKKGVTVLKFQTI